MCYPLSSSSLVFHDFGLSLGKRDRVIAVGRIDTWPTKRNLVGSLALGILILKAESIDVIAQVSRFRRSGSNTMLRQCLGIVHVTMDYIWKTDKVSCAQFAHVSAYQ